MKKNLSKDTTLPLEVNKYREKILSGETITFAI